MSYTCQFLLPLASTFHYPQNLQKGTSEWVQYTSSVLLLPSSSLLITCLFPCIQYVISLQAFACGHHFPSSNVLTSPGTSNIWKILTFKKFLASTPVREFIHYFLAEFLKSFNSLCISQQLSTNLCIILIILLSCLIYLALH